MRKSCESLDVLFSTKQGDLFLLEHIFFNKTEANCRESCITIRIFLEGSSANALYLGQEAHDLCQAGCSLRQSLDDLFLSLGFFSFLWFPAAHVLGVCEPTDRARRDIRPPAMSASLPGNRELPESQYDLNTYWGRVQQMIGMVDPR